LGTQTIFDGRLIDLGEGLRIFRHLPPGSHVSVCFSSPEMRRLVQAAFLADGLSEWLCVYAAQDEPLDQARRELESAGFPSPVDPTVMRWISGRELYGEPSAPDFSRWTSAIRGLYDDVRRGDLRGLRWTGDLPLAFARRGLHDELRALEGSVSSQFPGPYTILCTYEETPAAPSIALLGAFAAHAQAFRMPGTPVAGPTVAPPSRR
jgi:hypothetical protein